MHSTCSAVFILFNSVLCTCTQCVPNVNDETTMTLRHRTEQPSLNYYILCSLLDGSRAIYYQVMVFSVVNISMEKQKNNKPTSLEKKRKRLEEVNGFWTAH